MTCKHKSEYCFEIACGACLDEAITRAERAEVERDENVAVLDEVKAAIGCQFDDRLLLDLSMLIEQRDEALAQQRKENELLKEENRRLKEENTKLIEYKYMYKDLG